MTDVGAAFWEHSREGWLAVRRPEGIVLAANRAASMLSETPPDEIIGRVWWDLLERESIRRLGDWIALWRSGEDPGERTGLWLSRGASRPAPITLRAAQTGREGEARHFIILEDRRETQSLAERLDRAEARLEDTQRAARLGWWEWDIAQDALSWSDSLREIMGIPSGEFGGSLDTFLEGVLPDDRARLREQLELTLTRGEPFVTDFRTIGRDGSVRFLQFEAKLSRDEDKRPIRLYGTCQDVTERTLALLELTESERKYRDLVETSSELIWAVDVEGRLTFVNQAVREIYGYEPEEILGKTFTILLPPEQIPIDWNVFQSVLAGHKLYDYETVHLRKDGGRINLSFNAIARRDASGQVVGTTGTAIDITERKRQEELLSEREGWFRTIFENAPECLMILSPEGKLLDLNSSGRSMLEVETQDDLQGQSVTEFLSAASRYQFGKVIEAVRHGETRTWQAQLRGEKSSRGWLEGQMVPLRDSNGQVIRLLVAAQDVTARRKADALREGEQQVLEEIASGRDLSAALRTILKMLENQLPGALCAILLLEEEAPQLTVAASSPMPEEISRRLSGVPVVANSPSFADSVARGQRRIVEDTMTDRSWSSLRSLVDRFQLRSCWSQPIRGFSNDVLGVLVMFFLWPRSPNAEDLLMLETGAYLAGIAIHRTRTEQALRDREIRFRTLFEHSPDAIFVESMTGIVLDVNPAATELHGMSRERLIGRHVMELVPPQCRDDVRRDFPKLAAGELKQFESFSWHVERGAVPVSVHVSKTEYGSRPALLLHVRDITERRKAEEHARQVQSQLAHVGRLTLMGELMASISHEINQPLFAIANFASACEKTLRDDSANSTDKLLEWTHKIAQQATRAGEIIHRMRDFSRKTMPHRSTVAVADMVHEAIELVSAETKSQHISLTCDLQPENCLVLADRIQIEQTLINLLRNACRAMTDNPLDRRRIEIRTRKIGAELRFSVHDQGHGFKGINPEEIFNPFFTTKPDGLGLGLTISRSIVEAHGGKLWAEQNADHGATFLFTLPMNHDS
jgi:two-component system sensor kinase FixL